MSNLKNAPLIYTLGMIGFPRIPEIGRFTDAFLDKVRKDYPIDDHVATPVFNANVGPTGLKIEQLSINQWQFASVDRGWGFILTDQAFCLHTNRYHDFDDFKARFRQGLEALLDIPNIGVGWLASVGIRYVDLVVPKNTDERLSQYLQSWLLPPEPGMEQMKILDGVYSARYKTSFGDMQLQVMRNPPFTLSPELSNQLIQRNGWNKARPETDFVLMDTDHAVKYAQLVPLNIEQVISTLTDLHGVSKKVFEESGTERAKTVWRG